MLKSSDHLHLNHQEEVAAQVFDDEAVIMRLTDGAYFNMNNVGGTVWEMIEQDSSVEGAVSAVVRRFEVPVGRAQADVLRLVEQLIQEKLVTSSNGGHQATDPVPDVPGEKLAYETPVLHRHDDMGDLLALDPPFGTDCKCGRKNEP